MSTARSRRSRIHLRRARTWLVRNPAYAPLGLRELHVNETVGGGDGLYPGEQLAYLAELERGHADLGGRACWLEPSGLDECVTPTLYLGRRSRP